MEAILVNFSGHQFLIPERGFSFFPTEFENRRQQLIAMSETYNHLVESLENPFSRESESAASEAKKLKSELVEFIAITGVVGAPFDSKDARLYAANNSIKIIAEIEF
ncbi:hypothetical protein WCT80_17775 [Pectobacterium carotovorum]|uniref:hypothetical protein n=1 Tax=Pectobacterium carotovorum TaxID=554 RepID=UPI003019D1FF